MNKIKHKTQRLFRMKINRNQNQNQIKMNKSQRNFRYLRYIQMVTLKSGQSYAWATKKM